MSLLKLIKSESGQLQLPHELDQIQLPHYRSDVSKITNYYPSPGNLSNIPGSPNNINSCNELIDESNDKSDYIIFSDFYDYTYEAGNIQLEIGRVTYTGNDNKTKISTYDDIHTNTSGLPNRESELIPYYVNYNRVKSFDLIEIPIPLIPDKWGDIIDLTISFWKSDSNDKLTVTKSIKLSQDIKTTVIHYMDLGTETGPIQYESVTDTYTDESGTGDITWSEFNKGILMKVFEVVSCYDNLFVYCINPLVTDYYISSCKINQCKDGI